MQRSYISRNGLKALVAAAALAVGGSALAAPSSIGVNFVDNIAGNGDSGVQNSDFDSLSGGESAGAPGYAQTNWNNFGRWGNPTAALDHTAGPTGVNVGWDATGTWGLNRNNPPTFNSGDEKLMSGYIDSDGTAAVAVTNPYSIFAAGGNKPQVYVNGLSQWLAATGNPSYSVVLYVDGDGTNGRIGEYFLQQASGTDVTQLTVGGDLTPHIFNNDTANFSGLYQLISSASTSAGAAESGNYIVFSGLTADSFLLRAEEAGGGQPFRAPINGFQIVAEVPEPGSLALLALGALGLARRRR